MRPDRKAIIQALVDNARKFQFCGPSDDPDEQTAVTTGYRHLVIQLKRLAGPILPIPVAERLEAIDVNDLYSAHAARAEVEPILFDIEDALEHIDSTGMSTGSNNWIIESSLMARLQGLQSNAIDVAPLARMCQEINSSYAHGNVLATALLMRTVLNHVPPVFGYETFEQVAANAAKSLKDSFNHLETGLRSVADFHTHRRITSLQLYPSVAQVEPFKPQFELLLQEVVTRIAKNPDAVHSPERKPERKPPAPMTKDVSGPNRQRELTALEEKIVGSGRKPYQETLSKNVAIMLSRMSTVGKRLMCHLLQNEPLEVGRQFVPDVSGDDQFKQLTVAMEMGIIRHHEVRVGSGNLLRTDYEINPQYRSVLEDALYKTE